jgi:hypothetical protein
MKLSEYPVEEIDAALRKKKMNRVALAKKVGRCTNAVTKAITGTETIKSRSLEEDILNELQPELDIIHQAFVNHEKV